MRTPPKPSANRARHAERPLIHITLQAATVRVGVVLIASAVLLSLGALGLASSPSVAGHPVLLTPERLAIKTYLDTADVWIQRLTAIDQQLALMDTTTTLTRSTGSTPTVITASPMITDAALAITVPPAIPLPTLAPPISWPDNLYDQAQQADRLVTDLAALDREQQRLDVPPALNALHTLARSATQVYGQYAMAALDVIGAPVPANIVALQNSRSAAQAALADLQAALAAQRQEIH